MLDPSQKNWTLGPLKKMLLVLLLLSLERFSVSRMHCQILQSLTKLDGVGPVDNRPYTDKLYHFVRKKNKIKINKNKKLLHVTHDMWHMTCDTWHVTYGGGWAFSQNFSSIALKVLERQCMEDISIKDESSNYCLEVFVEQPRLHQVY